MEAGVQKERDLENEQAIGGMRNPRTSISKLPKSKEMGRALGELLIKAADRPSVQGLVDNLLSGTSASPIEPKLVDEVTRLVLDVLDPFGMPIPDRTAKADSPLNPKVLWAWGVSTDDPDACTLAKWVLQGAPLGFSEPIESNGIFPRVDGSSWEQERATALSRCLEGWENYPSAIEESDDLLRLIQEAREQGFCSFYRFLDEVETELGIRPVLTQ